MEKDITKHILDAQGYKFTLDHIKNKGFKFKDIECDDKLFRKVL